jgi:2-polyprenyl-6-methoxyphenol hydroxylase-like FAD-dependent oxidoreductase
MAPASPLRIAIVGAGSSGLLLALLLQRQGHDVSLLERAPGVRSDGCGILLVSAGLEAVLAAGLPQLVADWRSASQPVRQFVFRNLRGGLIEASEPDQDPQKLPSLLIHRRVVLESLASTLSPGCFQGGWELRRWCQDGAGVHLEAADGRRWSGDLLVGADGIFSRVAPGLDPGHRLNYLGDRVWRGVIEDDSFCRDGQFIVYTRGRGVYANVFDLGPDPSGRPLTHWGFFHEEPLPQSREDQKRLLREPIPEDALKRLPEDVAALMRATPLERQVANWSFDLDPLQHLVQGRVALIGDAGHAMSSSQARGMTAGLEDAECLARQLAANHEDPQAALRAYERERLPRVHAYQSRSREISNRIGRARRPPAATGSAATGSAAIGSAAIGSATSSSVAATTA